MLERKIFVLDSQTNHHDGLELANRLLNAVTKLVELKLVISKERFCDIKHLPEDFDAYLLHFSEVSEENIIEIKNKQPWSWMYGITGAGSSTAYLRKYFDRTFYILSIEDYKEILEEIQRNRETTIKRF